MVYLLICLPQTKNYEQKKKYYLQKGKDRFVAVLPTGFGKSLLFQALPDFFPVKADNIIVYYFSKLVRALWLANLAGHTLLLGPLKFKVVFVAKLLRDLSPKLLNYLASEGLQLSFTLNCVLKRANDLKTISNRLLLLSNCFRNLKPFLMDRNRSRTRQTHNRDIINILLTSSSQPVL